MNRMIILGLAATIAAAGNFYARATLANPPVELQTTTPGVAQTGHSNITGTATSGVVRAGTVFGNSTATTGIASGGDFRSASTSGRGVLAFVSATTGQTYGGLFQNASSEGRALFGLATSPTGRTYGGYFRSSSIDGTGLFGFAAAPTGTTVGVYGKSTSPDGYGVYSDGNMHATGVISGSGSGLTGVNAELLNGLNSSAFLQSVPNPLSLTGSSGTSVIKGENASSASGASGVYGFAAAETGTTYGVYGKSASPGGYGVYSDGNLGVTGNMSATGEIHATYGEFHSPTAIAVDAYAHTGVQGGGHQVGGFFYASGLPDITSYGVIGESDTPLNSCYGVFSYGDTGASGVKSFRIDHPFDPENKYLLHYAAESPMPQNFYVGNVVTDAKGYAWVQLPDYFAEINTNFKYQLTVVDDSDADSFVIAKISKVIRGTRFQIRTSAPNTEVSWEVKADRNDLYVQKKKPKDVVEKQGREKGKYQHPELYGLGPERGMNYDPEREKRHVLPAPRQPNPPR